MSDEEYLPSASRWVRDQVSEIERAGDTAVVGVGGHHVVLMTVRGKVSGKLRKVPVMRVEHDGRYAADRVLADIMKDAAAAT